MVTREGIKVDWEAKAKDARRVFVVASHTELELEQEFKPKQVPIMARHGGAFTFTHSDGGR